MGRVATLILASLVGALALSLVPVPARGAERPPWLHDAIARTLTGFGGARPTRIDTIGYPRKVAVVFTFARPTRFGPRFTPFGDPAPRFRVWRIGLYRPGYHSSTGEWRGCTTRHACLYR